MIFGNALAAEPPYDMVMPALGQSWFFVAMCVPVVVALFFALRYWRSSGSPIGLLFLLGGAWTYFNEPIVDTLGKCWHPAFGIWTYAVIFGIHLPMFGMPVYMWYMGGQAFLAYRLYEKGISMRGLFLVYLLFMLTDCAFEIPALNLGLYVYYGDTQPLVFMNFPLWWPFVNSLMPMMMAAVVFRLDSLLLGPRRLLVIPLMWMLGAATNGLVGAPVWVAIHADVGIATTHLAALITICCGLMVCYAIGLLVAENAPLVHGRNDKTIGRGHLRRE
ncbi:MAG: hypothetical protein JWQ90_3957 [Hydrocarboniphaga sp.]|uniref:hypothetical protein n=1 Tax=Hydrocarboniphaga sp. TaxID=2033016 RepID=UPI0026264ED5|nr:hypothetical protein [Hydrocarboniphaga sp.]MDB5971507.1 hypothetical protein [Hydrocarboniphaga sp.]